jgi:LmbE family N-acetylglucosaminyl deacetylase
MKAAEACAASYLHMGFLDAPFRNNSYRKLHNIFGEIHPNDAATVTILRQAIETVLRESNAESAYFPLAIGGHIDHRLTFLAAQDLQFDGRKYFYEDRPYVFAPRSRQRRLRLLGIAWRDEKRERFNPCEAYGLALDLNLRGEFAVSLFGLMKLARRYLFRSGSDEKTPSIALQPTIEEFSAQTAARALRAIACYSTQITAITGTIDRWARCSARYSRRAGLGHAERFWSSADC